MAQRIIEIINRDQAIDTINKITITIKTQTKEIPTVYTMINGNQTIQIMIGRNHTRETLITIDIIRKIPDQTIEWSKTIPIIILEITTIEIMTITITIAEEISLMTVTIEAALISAIIIMKVETT